LIETIQPFPPDCTKI